MRRLRPGGEIRVTCGWAIGYRRRGRTTVIPQEWQPYRRSSDNELIGYLVEQDDVLVVPTTLVGTPLGAPQEKEAARSVLLDRGLSTLMRRWWCRLPARLSAGMTPADSPRPDWSWRAVLLVEVNAVESRVRPEMPAPEEMTAQAVLPTPVGDLLRVSQPD